MGKIDRPANLYIAIGFSASKTAQHQLTYHQAQIEHTIQYKDRLSGYAASQKLIENCERISNVGLLHIRLGDAE